MIFEDGPRSFKLWSSDEDDTCAGTSLSQLPHHTNCGVAWKGAGQLRIRPRRLTMAQNYEVHRQVSRDLHQTEKLCMGSMRQKSLGTSVLGYRCHKGRRDVKIWRIGYQQFRSDGKQKVWRKSNTAMHAKNVRPTAKFEAGNLIIWGCMTSSGVRNLHFVDVLGDVQKGFAWYYLFRISRMAIFQTPPHSRKESFTYHSEISQESTDRKLKIKKRTKNPVPELQSKPLEL
ncbi:hypothetical protein TNCV_232791 [Trichonephila clavipes]|nr:hypothetical protein TNCV_232791 [Trichonephila clavipes]